MSLDRRESPDRIRFSVSPTVTIILKFMPFYLFYIYKNACFNFTAETNMMRTTARRLRVLGNHFVQAGSIKNSVSPPQDSPYFVVTPRTSLIDETVAIRLHGLEPNQMVRLDATVVENRLKFESHAVYRASTAGVVDLETDASLAGTYTGIHNLKVSHDARKNTFKTEIYPQQVFGET